MPRVCIFLALAAPLANEGVRGDQTRNLHTDLADVVIRLRTDHYALAGTVSDERLADYGRALEYIHQEYATGFAQLLNSSVAVPHSVEKSSQEKKEKVSRGLQPEKGESTPSTASAPSPGDSRDGRFVAIVLATEAHYAEFTHAYFAGRAEHTRGLYVPAVKLLLIRDDPDSHETYEILFHEAFHQFVHRHLPTVPMWVNEGLATYYGTARPTASGLVFDRPRSIFFKVVRDAADARCLIPLPELMLADSSTFLSPEKIEGVSFTRGVLHYAQAYTLVAFMLSDDAGAEHLREYLRSLAMAKNAAASRQKTQESFPDTLLHDMVTPWLAFVNKH